MQLASFNQIFSVLQSNTDLARDQEAKLIELEASTSRGRIWISQGNKAQALELLEPVYDWFYRGLRRGAAERGEGSARRAVLRSRQPMIDRGRHALSGTSQARGPNRK